MERLLKPTILSISFLIAMGGAAISPALGDISKAFPAASPETIKMIISLPAIMIMIFSLLSGKLAPIISKRNIFMVGIAFYLVGGIGGAFTTTFNQLLLCRVIVGVGAGLIMPLTVAFINDYYEGDEKVKMIGLSPGITCLGGVIASFIGGFLAALNWRYAFYIYCIAIPVLILIVLVLPKNFNKSSEIKLSDISLASLPNIVFVLAFLQFLLMLVFFSLPTNLSTFIHTHNVGNSALAGLALAGLNIFGFIGGLIFSATLKKLGKYIPVVGIACMAIGFCLLSIFPLLIFIIMGTACLGFGFGILQPLIYLKVVQAVPSTKVHLAMTLISSALFLGQFSSPILLGLLGDLVGNTSSQLTFLLPFLMALTALFICLMILLKPFTSLRNISN